MMMVIILVYLLSAVLWGISLRVEKLTVKKIKQLALLLAKEITFGLLIFSVVNIVASYAIEAYENIIWKYQPEYSGVFKVLAILLIIVNYFVFAIYYR